MEIQPASHAAEASGLRAEEQSEVAPAAPALLATASEREPSDGSEAPVTPSPVPARSREQELQASAERRSPLARELGRSHRAVYVLDDLLFDAGRWTLSLEVRETLDRLAERLRLGDLDYVLEIRGHTDRVGSESGNLELGRLRAEAVRRYLETQCGLPAPRLRTTSLGESLPLGESTAERPSPRERRVTVRVLEPLAEASPGVR